MNLQDCIDIIKNCTTLACEYHIKNKCEYGYEVRENRFECAKEMAIKAIEEIQQYRAIGTIEEFKALKEFKKTITEIVDRQLIAGSNNYKETYDCFQKIAKVVQDNY